jgi:hypothetical protein
MFVDNGPLGYCTVNNYRQVTGMTTGENFAFSYTGTARKLYRQML